MKRIVTAAAALSFIATAALADDAERDHGDRGGGDRGGRAAAQQRNEPRPAPAPPQAREARQPREQARGPRPEAMARPAQVEAQPQPQIVRREFDGRSGIPVNGARGPSPRPPEARTVESGPPPQVVRPERRQEQRSERPSGPFGEAVSGARAAARRDHPEWDRNGGAQRDGDRNGWSRDGRDGRGEQARGDPNRYRNGSDQNRDGDRADRDRNGDRNGWSRDGGRGGWDNSRRGPAERPSWARPDGRWDRDHDRNRYDPRRYPRVWQTTHRYRVSTFYIAPYGYYDRGWSYGDYLPWGWYGPSYWIEDWFAYGLPPPPIGCEWVRVGRDAILVDTFTGQVISVARLLFW